MHANGNPAKSVEEAQTHTKYAKREIALTNVGRRVYIVCALLPYSLSYYGFTSARFACSRKRRTIFLWCARQQCRRRRFARYKLELLFLSFVTRNDKRTITPTARIQNAAQNASVATATATGKRRVHFVQRSRRNPDLHLNALCRDAKLFATRSAKFNLIRKLCRNEQKKKWLFRCLWWHFRCFPPPPAPKQSSCSGTNESRSSRTVSVRVRSSTVFAGVCVRCHCHMPKDYNFIWLSVWNAVFMRDKPTYENVYMVYTRTARSMNMVDRERRRRHTTSIAKWEWRRPEVRHKRSRAHRVCVHI